MAKPITWGKIKEIMEPVSDETHIILNIQALNTPTKLPVGGCLCGVEIDKLGRVTFHHINRDFD